MPISQRIVIAECIKSTWDRRHTFYIHIRHQTDGFEQLLALLSPYFDILAIVPTRSTETMKAQSL
jgi:hypothetical protein